jgi:serine protease Do
VRGYLGVALSDPSPDQLGEFEPESDVYRGVYVGTVEDDSPASRAGLQEGDLIVKFQGQPVNEARLRTAIGISRPGTRAEMEVLRKGKKQTLTASIGDYAAILSDRAATQNEVTIDELGVQVRTYTRQMARDDGYRDPRVKGVQVVQVRDGSVAQRTGLQPGDIILEAAGQSVSGAKEFVELVGKGEITGGVQLGVVRGNRLGGLVVAR